MSRQHLRQTEAGLDARSHSSALTRRVGRSSVLSDLHYGLLSRLEHRFARFVASVSHVAGGFAQDWQSA